MAGASSDFDRAASAAACGLRLGERKGRPRGAYPERQVGLVQPGEGFCRR